VWRYSTAPRKLARSPSENSAFVRIPAQSLAIIEEEKEKMMAEVTLNPKTTALLLQDLQNELIKGSRPVVPLSGPELIANCQRLLVKARTVGMPMIYVRVSRRPDLRDAPRPPLGTPPGAGGAPSLVEGTEGAAIVAELAPHPEDVVVTKHTTLC